MTGNTLEQRARELLAASCEDQVVADDFNDPLFSVFSSEALRAIAAALRLPAGEGWQPIETAPEGVLVLLWVKWSDIPVVGEITKGRVHVNTEHHETSCGAYCYGGTPSTAHNTEATHWQPLPAAPRHETGDVDRG